jgi:hypothetical protein
LSTSSCALVLQCCGPVSISRYVFVSDSRPIDRWISSKCFLHERRCTLSFIEGQSAQKKL